MAEIEMERRPGRNVRLWVLVAVLIVVIAIGAWFLLAGDAGGYDVAPAAERPAMDEPVREQPYDPAQPPAPGADRPLDPEPDPDTITPGR